MASFAEITCMVIDDDASTLMTIGRMLESAGVSEVLRCQSAKEALDILSHGNISVDIVFSDLNMPDMDGIQLLRHFTSLGNSFGVVLVSAEDPRLLESVHKLASQLKLHILGTVNKPVSIPKLLQILNNYSPIHYEASTSPGAMVFAEELESALRNNQIDAFLQPQVCLKTNKLVGCEALARWHHPEKGWIPPSVFIGIAEKYNMITELTRKIFTISLDHLQKANNANLDISLSINYSPQVLNNLELPETLDSGITERGLSPKKITIEVTESTVAEDMSITLDILTRLRLKGFGLSIDDFGTGFSSLEQVNQIPFTELKIDRSFVHSAIHDSASQAILESSVALVKLLDIKSVAEGVETLKDLQNVRSLGCDIAQGFYIAKPMPIDEFLNWAREFESGKNPVILEN